MRGGELIADEARRAIRALSSAHIMLFTVTRDATDLADLEGGALDARPIYLASLSKGWIGMLARECRSDWPGVLTDPLDDLLPELPAGFTMARLLTMDVGGSGEGAAHFGFGPQISASERLRRWSARGEFGRGFSYHNACYVAAAMALERYFNTSIPRLVANHICELYGIEKPCWITATPQDYHPPSYQVAGETRGVPLIVSGNSLGAGGGFATPALLADWLRLNLAHPLPADLPQTAVPEDPMANSYGFGWFTGHIGDHDILFHSGSGPGYGLYAMLFPDAGMAFGAYSDHHRSLAVAACLAQALQRGLIGSTAFDEALETARAFCSGIEQSDDDHPGELGVTGSFRSREAGLMTITNTRSGPRLDLADCPYNSGYLHHADDGLLRIRADHPAVRLDPDPSEQIGVRLADCHVELAFFGRFERIDAELAVGASRNSGEWRPE